MQVPENFCATWERSKAVQNFLPDARSGHNLNVQEFSDLYSCQCAPGYTGSNCDQNIDECLGVECQNGGSCVDMVNAFKCECASGFTGPNCEEDIYINECLSFRCQNGGVCINVVNAFECICPTGFSGDFCEVSDSPCSSNPCVNGGTCRLGGSGFVCDCYYGFSGTVCDEPNWNKNNLSSRVWRLSKPDELYSLLDIQNRSACFLSKFKKTKDHCWFIFQSARGSNPFVSFLIDLQSNEFSVLGMAVSANANKLMLLSHDCLSGTQKGGPGNTEKQNHKKGERFFHNTKRICITNLTFSTQLVWCLCKDNALSVCNWSKCVSVSFRRAV